MDQVSNFRLTMPSGICNDFQIIYETDGSFAAQLQPRTAAGMPTSSQSRKGQRGGSCKMHRKTLVKSKT